MAVPTTQNPAPATTRPATSVSPSTTAPATTRPATTGPPTTAPQSTTRPPTTSQSSTTQPPTTQPPTTTTQPGSTRPPTTSPPSTTQPPTTKAPADTGGIWQPAPRTLWQWQLTGTIDTSVDVPVYDIDLFDTPTATINTLHQNNRIVICYFSAGSWEDWRPDADEFDPSLLGQSNGWPGEKWLDIRKIDQLRPVMEARMDRAVSKGCDAVEPDNVDGYQNSTGFALTAQHQINYNSFIADLAHKRGLSVGLKNSVDLIDELEPHFDWALNEECMRYDECDGYTTFIRANKAVFHVEYRGNRSYCPASRALGLSSLEKDLDLSAIYRPC